MVESQVPLGPDSRLVIVGASLAGLRAAEAARKAQFTGRVTLIGAEEHLPYDRPPLSKAYLEPSEPADVIYRPEQMLREELGVELLLGTPATGLDVEAKQVLTDSGPVHYDALVIATGANARRLPGTEGMGGVHTLRTLDDAQAIRGALDNGARTVVVGAGFIGSEIASGAAKRGLDVTVVEAAPTPLVRAVGEQMGASLAGLHYSQGLDLRCGVGVKSLVGDGAVERVVLADGTEIPAQLVVAGIGAVPATDWLAGSGITVENGVVCDATLHTGVDSIYAAGDVARWRNPLFGTDMRLEHWTSAAEQGAVAARNALGITEPKEYGTVPYFWSDWYDSRIQFVGVPEASEVTIVDGEPGISEQWIALYQEGDRLVGALAVNSQSIIMKLRAMISKGKSAAEAAEFIAKKRKA